MNYQKQTKEKIMKSDGKANAHELKIRNNSKAD